MIDLPKWSYPGNGGSLLLKLILFLVLTAVMILLFITRWDRIKMGFKAFGVFWLAMAVLFLLSNWEDILGQRRFDSVAIVALGSAAFYGLAWLVFNYVLPKLKGDDATGRKK
jgi:hypothetical protein